MIGSSLREKNLYRMSLREATRETVRSGRRANFFITENKLIDHYAAKVGGSGVAVYSILQRCANSETRETWISAQKMADVLAMDKSTVYRHLKQLEDLRLIRTLRTREKTIYVVLPVPPPRPEAGSTPLFDTIGDDLPGREPTWSPVASVRADCSSESELCQRDAEVASVQRQTASMRQTSRISEKCNKEEQDSLNKTQDQDFFNNAITDSTRAAQVLVKGLMLSDASMSAAKAAIEDRMKEYPSLSMDLIVVEIANEARRKASRRITNEKFLENFLAKKMAEKMLETCGLPGTDNLISAATDAIKAEVTYLGVAVEDAAARIADAVSADMADGVTIKKFYFENAEWRNRGRTGKGQQQFDRIRRARDEAHAIIDARFREVDH
jgi:DNA-binding transcriptional ArsR family regulator